MRELQGGQIVPAAQPVDAFIRPTNYQQAPGLQRIQVFSSGPGQISGIQQQSGGSVQGFNQWAQLASALAPFNDALTKTLAAGGEMYAKGEYEKGQNDAIKAQILANQQRLQGGAAYAAETRRLEGLDPEAARMMDRVNPFRQAGRDNQRARMAAEEAKTYILQAYRETPGAKTWKPGDPRLAGLKVQATQQILDRFGLDQSSAGFQDYVNPEIAQAWDRVSTEQWEDFQNFQKDTVAPMAAVELMQIHSSARTAGQVEWTELDPVSLQPVRRVALLGSNEWRQGLRIKLNQTLDRIASEMGLRGETTEHTRRAVMQLVESAGGWAMAEGDPEKLTALSEIIGLAGDLEVGPPGRDGRRIPAGILYAPDFLRLARQQDKDRFELQARAEAQALATFSNDAAQALLMAPAGTPEHEAAVQQLLQQAAALGVPTDKALEQIDALGRRVDGIAERGANATDVEELFIALEAMDPSSFDTKAAMDVLKGRISALPVEMQRDYLKRLGSLAASKGKEAQNSKGSVINPILTRGIKAALERAYPQNATQAALRGVKDMQGFLALGDANARTAAARLEEGARKHMLNRLAEAARAKGERLDAAEETAIATTAFNEYLNTKDQGLKEYLFPGGLGGGPGVQGGKVQQPQGPMSGGAEARQPPPGRVWSKAPVVSSSNLDNVDPERLKRGDVVLEKPSTMNEVERVLMGQPPSAAVRRAARAAGMPVGQWLLRQAEAYGILDSEGRRELLRRTNQGQAAGQKVSSSARPGNPYGQAASWLADLMMGTRPAMASQGGGGNLFPFSRGQFPGGTSGRGGDIQGVYRQAGWGPRGRNEYGDHHDIKRLDGGRFERNALDRYVLVDGKPLSRGTTVKGGQFGAQRSYGEHRAWDYAFERGKGNLTLTGGARWISVTKGSYGDEARFRTPDGKVYRIIHGNFSRGGGQGGRPMPARGTMTGQATYYTGSGGSDGVLGGKTANGETFTGKQMTAAVQWSLKPKLMNKWLIVEDANTGRRIRVWANDTGQMGGSNSRPAGRLIDLSPVAFIKLFGSTSRGVGNIRVMVDPNQRGRP
jgi:hypothetical protein